MKKNITKPQGHIRGPETLNAHADYNGHLAAIIESSDDAIISKSLDGTIQSWNKSCEKMFGFSEEQAVGKNISIIIPREYLPEEKKIVQRICNNESIEHYKTVRKRKNGERVSVSLTVSPIKNNEKVVVGVSKIIRDITSQKRSEKELIDVNRELFSQNEEKEKRAAELVIANKELAFQNEEKEKRASELIVANKELLFQNEEKEKRAAELIIANKELAFQSEEKEKRADELVIANKELAFQNEEKEKRASELIVANKELLFQNEEKEKRADELVIANKELAFQNEEKEKRASELVVANKELLFQNEEKEKRAAELVIANKELAFQNEEKEKRASELIVANKELLFQNEEKEKRADELVIANKELAFQNEEKEKRATELTVANKALESFSYSVSHDLRAPLRHISGFVDLLTNRFRDTVGEKEKHYLNNISESAHQMGALIDDLLQFSRTGRQEMQRGKVDMNTVIQEAIHQIMQDNPDRMIAWVIANLPIIFGDYALLRLVWINMLSNAVKFTRKKEQARIEIGFYSENEEIIFFVRDNGVGFDMQYSQKLFGVFQRMHSMVDFEGTGVGLANVRQIISKHQGRTWAEAEIDKGATFYFTIPLYKEGRQ